MDRWMFLIGILAAAVFALTASSQTPGYVSLTFDDGYVSHIKAAELLDDYGFKGVFFIPSGISSFEGRQLMNLSQVAELARRGHEIGSHSLTHPRAANLSPQQFDDELLISKSELEKRGISVTSFAYPYGEGLAYEGLVAKYYAAARAVERCINTLPVLKQRRYDLCGWETAAANHTEISETLEEARRNRGWLILGLHDINDLGPRPQYDLTTTQLKFVLDKIKESGLKVITIKDALERGLFSGS